nr:PilZ domain-containing protein [uncultured Desulfobulbus sp.]
MDKKINWDSIPSLEGLEVDWEYEKKNVQDKRAFVRLDLNAIGQLFECSEIPVKVATVERVHQGTLLDLSTGGAAVLLNKPLTTGQPVKIGFILNTVRVLAKGQVRHVQQIEQGVKVGIQFIDLEEKVGEFIGGLYASKVFRHAY